MDFKTLLEQVRTGAIDSFEVTPDNYREFYEAWRDYPAQNAIRGIASIGGNVTYRRNEDS